MTDLLKFHDKIQPSIPHEGNVMISFKDFNVESAMLGLFSGPFEDALNKANAWIKENRIDVINVETLTGTVVNGISPASQEGVRIWFKT